MKSFSRGVHKYSWVGFGSIIIFNSTFDILQNYRLDPLKKNLYLNRFDISGWAKFFMVITNIHGLDY